MRKKNCLFVSQILDFLSNVPGNTPVMMNSIDDGINLTLLGEKPGILTLSVSDCETTWEDKNIYSPEEADDSDESGFEPLGVPTLDVDDDSYDEDDD